MKEQTPFDVAIIGIGLQPPNEKAAWVVGGTVIVLLGSWLLVARHRFAGPPVGVVSFQPSVTAMTRRMYSSWA